ncbi:MAG: L-aspartate oxidase [Acidimicrobiales bacterium]
MQTDADGSIGEHSEGLDLDVLVVGSGVAGLSAVVHLAEVPGLRVGILTKGELSQSATAWAQGGVAAVIGGDEDSTDLHLADTLAAGAGLCDDRAVRVLVDEGPLRVRELIGLGAVFDSEESGRLARGREGGHSTARILHAGGAATGAEVERALVAAVVRTAAAVLERWLALDLLVAGGRCIGVSALDPAGAVRSIRATQVVVATGGAGQMFAVTTNPNEATGDGIAMALRAGVPVADVEFVQFHPTALHHPAMPRPLLSEALRGHGAILRDADGERFVDELAPRDVVSRAMAERMSRTGVDHLWLDATALENFDRRFPTVAESLRVAGLDPAVDWLPIAPAAHYISGGVLTDLDGASALPGLWAAGEASCTGVHGANRLASNSLLEGMVFGARVADALRSGRTGPEPTGVMEAVLSGEVTGAEVPCTWVEGRPSRRTQASEVGGPHDTVKMRALVQRAMTEGAGVSRTAASLESASRSVSEVASRLAGLAVDRSNAELSNLCSLASALLVSAEMREETRGAHSRLEFPEARPEWKRRLVHGNR